MTKDSKPRDNRKPVRLQQGFWVVVPAAGTGKRMQANRPKQYLSLAGKTVLQQTFDRLLSHPRIEGLVVAIAEADDFWAQSGYTHDRRVKVVVGGEERCHSVINGLELLAGELAEDEWVMVHDVARPCISVSDLDQLIMATHSVKDGAVLGVPVRDTMKQVNDMGQVSQTVDRSCLWHAYTPQIFRLGQLRRALTACNREQGLVTDESSAMEALGYRPQMVRGRETNIKITQPDDLVLAEVILQRLQGESEQ